MRYRDIIDENKGNILSEAIGSPWEPFDFNPEVDRTLFDLDLMASHGSIPEEDHRLFRIFLHQNRMKYIRLYHGTSPEHDVVGVGRGLLPTSRNRAKSLQSGAGFVYLTYDPNRALSFAQHAYPGLDRYVVYGAITLIGKLKPDLDQLFNKRQWSDRHQDIGSTLADSLIYGGGARYKGKLTNVGLYAYYDKNGQKIEGV